MNETKTKPGEQKTLSTKKHKHETPCKCHENVISKSEGELVIVVVRTSFNIPLELPYCIWGTLYISGNNFATVLQPYLSAGLTVTTSFDGNQLTFTYRLGALQDQIIVTNLSMAVITYLETLQNLNTNYMKSNFMLFNCAAQDDVMALTPTQIKNFQSRGLFIQKIDGGGLGGGGKEVELIVPSTRYQPNNSVSNVLDIYLRNTPIKAETVWIHSFNYTTIPAASVIAFTFTIFISEKINLNEMRYKITH